MLAQLLLGGFANGESIIAKILDPGLNLCCRGRVLGPPSIHKGNPKQRNHQGDFVGNPNCLHVTCQKTATMMGW
jgi:hypothetical protein